MRRGVLVGSLAVLLAGACVKHAPCRPGTILLSLQLGELPQVDLQVRGGGLSSRTATIHRPPGSSTVAVEIRLPSYHAADRIELVVTSPDGTATSQEVTLAAGCTPAVLQVSLSDGGAEQPDGETSAPPDATLPAPDVALTPPDRPLPDAESAPPDAAAPDARDAAPAGTDAHDAQVPGSDAHDAAACTATGPCSPADCKTGVYSCASGTAVCVPNGGMLVDGIACGATGAHRACKTGVCACAPGYGDCAGTCIDTTSDPRNCGTCGHACGAKMSCAGSTCACMAGLTACPDGCVDLQFDDDNCSACGLKCPATTSCGAGACL